MSGFSAFEPLSVLLLSESLRQISELNVTIFQEEISTHHFCVVNWFPFSKRISSVAFIFVMHTSMHPLLIFQRNKCFKVMLDSFNISIWYYYTLWLWGIFTSSTSSFHLQAQAAVSSKMKWFWYWLVSWFGELFLKSKFCFSLYQTCGCFFRFSVLSFNFIISTTSICFNTNTMHTLSCVSLYKFGRNSIYQSFKNLCFQMFRHIPFPGFVFL